MNNSDYLRTTALIKIWQKKQLVFIGDKLDAGEIGQTTVLEHFQNGKACGVLPITGGEYQLTVVRGGKDHESVTDCLAPMAR